MRTAAVLALALVFGLPACASPIGGGPSDALAAHAPRRMADGKLWITRNLSLPADGSYCYDDDASNCALYGRLYDWDLALSVCPRLGAGWRLPTNEEWRALATAYGGLYEESEVRGRAAYAALVEGGASGFDVLAGGGRTHLGEYARGGDHGFFWTATESGPEMAWLYNLGRNAGFINRHRDTETARAVSVRCVHD